MVLDEEMTPLKRLWCVYEAHLRRAIEEANRETERRPDVIARKQAQVEARKDARRAATAAKRRRTSEHVATEVEHEPSPTADELPRPPEQPNTEGEAPAASKP